MDPPSHQRARDTCLLRRRRARLFEAGPRTGVLARAPRYTRANVEMIPSPSPGARSPESNHARAFEALRKHRGQPSLLFDHPSSSREGDRFYSSGRSQHVLGEAPACASARFRPTRGTEWRLASLFRVAGMKPRPSGPGRFCVDEATLVRQHNGPRLCCLNIVDVGRRATPYAGRAALGKGSGREAHRSKANSGLLLDRQ